MALTHGVELKPTKTNIIGTQTAYDGFVKEAEEYRKKSKEYLRCLRDAPVKAKIGTKVDIRKMPECNDGKRGDVIREYNQFIDHSNTRKFP